ncbi:helix-turn-helix domain-containing protein [Streptomyces sp. NPDC091292]|uniref:helix-turn-helix domain-containing protein n=1 Tax=Streptomyces sp. NPDC091292 TaxID=3365991 RepID=UPI003810BD43
MPPPPGITPASLTPRPLARHITWHWATPQAQDVLATRDLGAILRFHRQVHGQSQLDLATLLGYDKTYISALELRKRRLTDLGSLRHVAQSLSLPPHALGITDAADSDHRAVIQFGESTVRLAEIARQSGHASEAVAELWPLVARLEARVDEGYAEHDVLHLLARARLGLGTALGNVLPEEHLSTAAHWTAKSLDIARRLDDPALTWTVLRMHGNELRKAGLHGAAVDRLTRAATLAPSRGARAAVLPLLARAAGALGSTPLFDRTIKEANRMLDEVDHTSLFNPVALSEIHMRGLVGTGRNREAVSQAERAAPTPTIAVAPQWRVIQLITVGRVSMLAGDHAGAGELFTNAVHEAAEQRLPHQLQRVLRATGLLLPSPHEAAARALCQLRAEMAA